MGHKCPGGPLPQIKTEPKKIKINKGNLEVRIPIQGLSPGYVSLNEKKKFKKFSLVLLELNMAHFSFILIWRRGQ